MTAPQMPQAEPPPNPSRRVREPAHGNRVVRMLGWTLGAAVILGTALVVLQAVTGPAPREIAAAAKPVRVCPPVVSVPARALGFPVDDLMGVRPGMNARDVEETVKCISEDYALETQALGNGAMPGQKSRPLLVAKRGQETASFALFGPAGAEQVAAAWRETYFDVGQGPSLPAVESMLVAQYGAPHEARTDTNGVRIITWTYAPDGRPLRSRPREGDITGTMTYMALGWTVAACVQNVRADPAATLAWDSRCGLTIRAEISPTLSDAGRTARWRLFVFDQATLARLTPPRPSPATPG